MKKFASLLFLFSWSLGYLAQIRFPLIALDIAAGVLLLANWKSLRESLKRKKRELELFGVLGIFLLSWALGLRMFSIHEALPGFLYLARTSMYLVILVFAQELLWNVRHWIPVTLWMFIGLGFLQYALIPDTRFLLASGWDEHYYRLIGTVLDPNYMGAMLGVLGVFGVFEFFKNSKKSTLALALSSFASLVLTFSRASWLATIIGLLELVVRRPSKKVGPYKVRPFPVRWLGVGGGAFIVIVALVMAPKPGGEGMNLLRKASVVERVESWKNALDIWTRHPWLGVGFNNYRIAKAHRMDRIETGLRRIDHSENAPSNSWLLGLATVGVLGVFGVSRVLRKTIFRVLNDPLWSAIAVVVGVHALFNNTLFYVPMLALLAILKGSSRS